MSLFDAINKQLKPVIEAGNMFSIDGNVFLICYMPENDTVLLQIVERKSQDLAMYRHNPNPGDAWYSGDCSNRMYWFRIDGKQYFYKDVKQQAKPVFNYPKSPFKIGERVRVKNPKKVNSNREEFVIVSCHFENGKYYYSAGDFNTHVANYPHHYNSQDELEKA